METPGFSIPENGSVCCAIPARADPATCAHLLQVRPLFWGICELETIDTHGRFSL